MGRCGCSGLDGCSCVVLGAGDLLPAEGPIHVEGSGVDGDPFVVHGPVIAPGEEANGYRVNILGSGTEASPWRFEVEGPGDGGGGGGAGGVLAWRQLGADHVQSTTGGTSRVVASTFEDFGGMDDTPLVSVSGLDEGERFTIDEAGWYIIRLATKAEFTEGSAPPAIIATLDSVSAWRFWKHTIPVTLGGSGNSSIGCWVDVTAGPWYCPAGDEWWPRLDWFTTDAMPSSLTLTIDIARVG